MANKSLEMFEKVTSTNNFKKSDILQILFPESMWAPEATSK